MPLVANAQADSPIGFERHAGATRYETAAEIAAVAYSASTDVVIATGEGFADALAGAALEGDLDAPVLLVPSDLVGGAVPTAVTDAIDDLGATTATLLGGPNAISEDVEDVADYLVGNSTVTTTDRVAGSTRPRSPTPRTSSATTWSWPAPARRAAWTAPTS